MGYDEQVLWVGQPKQGDFFSTLPLSSYVTSLLWTAACLFMFKLVNSLTMEGKQAFLLLWAVFIGIGIYGLIIWPFQAYYQLKNTVYVITNQKIYRQRGHKVKTLSTSEMNGYDTIYRGNGTGTISFPISTVVPGSNRPYRSEFKLENLTDTSYALQAIARMDGIE